MSKKPEVIIRKERSEDAEVIAAVTIAAFKTLAISSHTEQFIVRALRDAKALTVSLVAEIGEKIVGHIAFSPVTVADGTGGWYGLGPVSVLPDYQRQGIGMAMINEGLGILKEAGGKGCVLVGDPAYYNRFGFINHRQLVYEGIPQEFFLALPFGREVPRGSVLFHPGFQAVA
ncbi:GNAT family N-acetyltransferase [Desulforhopalus singaporensis]|uniref:Putative acetyltransferase n=1 Tax=Desulforhopalus singaporensis TaxID=91360 RepID=A0A1H0V3D0_9BACT|nr:N-acetyltransferase [Desulforhopalus singaporensis]SDP72843.1 putative acetyltransferase [Desulforhopalus singaporensis]